MMSHEMPAMGQRCTVRPRPLPGETRPRRVADPASSAMLPDEGAEREFNDYWHDRYLDGSVALDWDRPKRQVPATDAAKSAAPTAPSEKA